MITRRGSRPRRGDGEGARRRPGSRSGAAGPDSHPEMFGSLWPLSSAPPPDLAPGVVHLYRADLDRAPGEVAALGALLSPAERERFSRQQRRRDRDRRVVARGVLRTLLSGYAGVAAPDLEIQTTKDGKPVLVGTAGGGLHFNLSHGHGLGLFAFTRTARVGVDVERMRSLPDRDLLAARFFSALERELYFHLPVGLRPEAFLRCWTRKEAILKAIGTGLPGGLDSFDVALTPGLPADVLGWRTRGPGSGRWTLRHVRPRHGWVGALALAGSVSRIRCWTWVGLHGTAESSVGVPGARRGSGS